MPRTSSVLFQQQSTGEAAAAAASTTSAQAAIDAKAALCKRKKNSKEDCWSILSQPSTALTPPVSLSASRVPTTVTVVVFTYEIL